MGQGHAHHGHHHHHHGHSHGGASGRMGWAFFLNLAFAVIELIGGIMTNSLAIMSDAVHDFGDAFAIGIAWALEKKSKQKSDDHYSYGYRRYSVMAAFLTGLILMAGSAFIVIKSVPRLLSPEQTHVEGMLALALLGVAVNGFAAWRMSKGESLNEKMILWHMLEDVMGWIVILVGSLVMMFVDLPILDPIMALGVAVWVLWNVFRHLKSTADVFLQATPKGFSLDEVTKKVKSLPTVKDLHHVHLWSLDGDHHILTAHVIVASGAQVNEVHEMKGQIKQLLFKEFHITEATIEVEWPDQACLDPHH